MRDKKKTTAKKTSGSAPVLAAKEPEPKITTVAVPADDAPKTAPTLNTKPSSSDKRDELTKSITEPETKTEEPDADITEDTGLDDAETNKAVDDIMAYESDVVLAVADSTAEARNKEIEQQSAPKKHRVFSTIVWTLVTFTVILIVVLTILLVMGDSLADKFGL